MKTHLKFIALVLSLFCAENLFSQIHFENGYFISNDGKRTECLIKNEDWSNNPVEFKYKLPADNNIRTGIISDVREFAINNYSKYVRADVKIDMSSLNINELTLFKSPVWEKKQIFLKVLVEGKASLYQYNSKKTEDRFFYKCDNSEIEQLVYKEYRPQESSSVMVNDSFKIQLQTRVICMSSISDEGNKIEYYKGSLVRYFTKFNQCADPSFKVVKTTYKRDILNIGVFGGINISSASLTNGSASYYDGKFDANPGFHVGMVVEYILPFNKNQWSFFLEPEYMRLKSEFQNTTASGTFDYTSLNLSLGAKRYFFINDKLKWFVSAQLHSLCSTNFDSYYTRRSAYVSAYTFDIREQMNFGLGVGVEWNRLFVELRGYTEQNLMAYRGVWDSHLKRWSLNVGYKLFRLSSKGAK